MTFERYMSLCLYHPEFGYYTQGHERTGVAADYFTSPDLHPVFARLVARQAAEMWAKLGNPKPFTWVEMGAGRGLFASDFLTWSKQTLPEFFAALDYVAIEPGARQREHIEHRLKAAGVADHARLLGNLEELEPVTGCFFSNELVDAFPVHVITRTGGRLREIHVTADGNELCEEAGTISNSAVAAYVARYAHNLDEGARSEVNLHAQKWVEAIGTKLSRGFVLTVDYGDTANRLFTPDRPRGTLMAYHGHTASEDYYAAPGETDLTAHVNFTGLIDAGRADGLEVEGFTTQEKFLLALGEANLFADLYDPGQSEVAMLDARIKLKRLISPEGMGNIFKILVQQRGASNVDLTGWKFDRREKEVRSREPESATS